MNEPVYLQISHPQGFVPIYIRWKYKWITGLILCFFGMVIYLASNHFPLASPYELPLSIIDRKIPFIPASIWIYFSLFIFIPVVYSLNRCVISLNIHLYSFIFTVFFSTCCFYLFPITYPRELFPIPKTTSFWTQMLIQAVRNTDQPINCAPSLHVSLAYQIALGFLKDQKRYFPLVFSWATLLALSTLTTKQHYFLDVILGGALAVATHWIFHHLLQYQYPAAACENSQIM